MTHSIDLKDWDDYQLAEQVREIERRPLPMTNDNIDLLDAIRKEQIRRGHFYRIIDGEAANSEKRDG